MTKEEKRQIMLDALDRAYDEVKNASGAEMDSEQFRILIKNIGDMEWLAREGSREGEIVPVPHISSNESAPVETGVAEPQKPEAPPEEESTVKMEDVRAALAKARTKGVNVAEIIRSFGVETFPQIEKNQYPAVLKKLEEALNAT